MSEPFWLVWNPNGQRPPSFRHPTADSAVAEAGRLAESNPGEAFFVLGAMGFASADAPRARFMSLVDANDEFVAANAADFDETDFTDPPAQPLVTEGYLPIQAAASARTLKHGEYRKGDRVRYVGRVAGTVSMWIGFTGSVTAHDRGWVYVAFDGPDELHKSCHPGNLEHDLLPQFEVGDRVRVKAQGLANVPFAAGIEGVLTEAKGPDVFAIVLDAEVIGTSGRKSDMWTAVAADIELVRPACRGS